MASTNVAQPDEAQICHLRLSGLSERVCRDGRLYKLAVMDDHTGRVKGFLWEPLSYTYAGLSVPGPVEALLKPRLLDGEPVTDILQIRPLGLLEVDNGAKLLPRTLCPASAHGALDELVAFNDRLQHPQLKAFVSRVLLDPRIGMPLLACRASMNHHHAERGGLLIHLMTGLAPVAAMARAAGLKGEEIELTEVGFLLHDLGKLSTVGAGDRRPKLGHLVRHESMTPVLLAAHLEWLESVAPQPALAIRYLLDFVSRPHATRGYAKFVGAEIVTMADQLNVAAVRDRGLQGMLGRGAYGSTAHV